MEIPLSEEQRQIVELVERFALQEIRPAAERIDRDDEFPWDIWRKMGALGLFGIGIPERYGGVGLDLLTAGLVISHMADSPGLALSYGAHLNLCAHNILRVGNEEQRQRFLPGLASGEKVGAMALTEPGAGSDATALSTRALRHGDGYLLNGSKTFITNAPVADLVLLYASTEPAAGPRGLSAFVIETDSPGFSVSKPLRKMGHHGSPTGEIALEDCFVPAENLLGVENAGVGVMMAGLDVERAFFAVGALALADRAFELALEYAQQRQQFGRPIAHFQLIQAKLADMYARLEAARGLSFRALAAAEQVKRGGKGTPIHKLAAAALLFAAETAEEVVDHALQIHGGYGYMEEYEICRLYRDVRLYTIGAGTSEVRRLVVARELLGM